MNNKIVHPLSLLLCSLVVALVASSSAFGAATITINNVNAPGVGFNDTTPAVPVGGNTGTTLGQQRLIAFTYAANIWGATLTSTTPIVINAQMTPLTCTATSAVLGSAGATTSFRDFTGAPFAGTWYSVALANKLFGNDLDGTIADINANFNSNLGNAGCLTGSFFYLGLDGNHGSNIDFVAVLQHEMGHGLGFATVTNASTGAQALGFPSIYDRFLMDDTTGKSWLQMTNTERATSSLNTHKLAWDGPQVGADVPSVLAFGIPVLKVNSPALIGGNYDAGTAVYGPAVTAGGVTGDLLLANDGVGTVTDGCEAFPAGFFTGKIALIDRGICSFKTKTLNAQNAGAIAMVMVNNVAGGPAPGLGDDATIVTPITIPSISLTLSDGNLIKAQLGGGVNGTVQLDMTVRAGADQFGKALLYTPNPFVAGSSVSHWDTIAFPNQLMEPNINGDLTQSVLPPQDLTFSQLRDIGWIASVLPNTISKTTGDPQNTALSQPFAIPFSVTVNPAVSGLVVTWTVNPNGSNAGATFPSTNSRFAVSTTNALGVAIAPSLTANGQPGLYSMNATVPGAGTTTFTLSNDPVPVLGNACATDTTQADFQAGVTNNTDVTASPGNVTLLNPANIDQQNLNVTNSGFGMNATNWVAQTFQPAVTGQLARVDLDLFCSGCTGTFPNLTVSIRATTGDLPTGADLATGTIPGFNSGVGGFFTANFASPPTLTAGTRYAVLVRPVSNPSAGTYAYVTSTASVYANGRRATSANSGGTWTGQVQDLGFITYMQTGFVASGDFVSGVKDSNPVVPGSTLWGTLAWTATVSGSTTLQFQAAASNSFGGPFNFVGPDNTAGTFFTSGASLAQFNGFRYLKYKAFFTTSDNTQTPTLNDVTVCYNNPTSPNVTGTKTKSGGTSPGSAVAYSVVLSNSGGVAQADNSGHEFTDAVPSSLTLGLVTATSGTITTVGNTVNWNGVIPPAGSVTITINATINLVPDTTVVSNQGTINCDADGIGGTNESARLTDDPSVVGTSDPTNFTVSDVNDPPDAVNDTLSNVAEDSAMRTIAIATLLSNDSKGPANESGQTLTLTGVGSPVGGTVSNDLTNVYFTPTANFSGAASFQYTITDNGTTGGSADPKTDSATASFTITEVNDAPTATGETLSNVAEDAGQTIPFATLTANDSKGPANESGQVLIVKTVSNPVGGTVSILGGNVLFTPTANYNGPASFDYTVEDNGTTNSVADPLTSGTATASFTITEVNDAPTATGETLSSVAEDSAQRTILFSALTTNDSTGPANESSQTLIVKTVSNPVGGTVSIVSGTVRFTPTADFNGAASFDYTVEDNGTTNAVADPKSSGTATASFTITEINDAPTAVNDALTSVAEDSGQRTIPFASLTGNDSKGPANEGGQTLIVKTVSNPVNGTVSILGGNVLFTPTAGYNGPVSFDYTVEDNGTTNGVAAPLTSGIATASFTVTEVNDTPKAENDPLGNIAEDSGPRSIPFATLTANDSAGPANESGQDLTVMAVSNPVGGTVSIVGNTVRFTPTANYNGQASFEYIVEDDGTTNGVADPKSEGPAIASFHITEVNDAPAAVNDTLTDVAEDSGQRTIPFATLTGNDSKGPANESGQILIVKTVSNPVGGTVSILAGNVLFTPAANFNGTASFDYTVEDNGTTNGVADPRTSGTATASFNITTVADTPSVTNATTNANTQTTSGLVISRNAADGVEVTHFKMTGITGGTLFKNNGTTVINNGNFITFAEGNAGLKFTPGTGNGSFTVQSSLSASDAGLGGGTATATITINPLGGVFRFSAANYSVAEGAGFRTITVERTGDTSQAATVDYASSDHSSAGFVPCDSPGAGFASSRCDFDTAIGTLRFAAGDTSKTFNVLITQDNYLEGPETLELNLSNPTGGAVFGSPQTAVLSIVDDTTEGATNPVDNSTNFVTQLYHDLLNREPDGPGLAFWTDNIDKCNDPARLPAGQTVAQCIDKQRELTAIAFFESPELQMTGGFVYRLYKGSLTGAPNYDGGSPGRFPTFTEFVHDVTQVSEGILVNNQIDGTAVEANRNRLAAEFVERPEFVAKYGGLNNTLYVQELFNTTGITPTAAEKQALVDGLTSLTETRASVLRKVVDGTVVVSESNVQFTTTYGQAFYNQEFRRVFVYMEYVGFLRRNPDAPGFVFWLGKLNQFNGDPIQAEMVRSFILSPEYRSRFGQP